MRRLVASVPLLALLGLLPLAWLRLGVPWMALVVSFVLVPALDLLVGRGAGVREKDKGESPAARWVPRSHVFVQIVLLAESIRLAPSLGPVDLAVFAVGVGTVTGGLGITVAHELGHRPSKVDRVLARILLVTVAYGHFLVEHVRGHHLRVATPADPASAPRGMGLYRFLLRSLFGGFVHAWQLEARRLARRGRSAWHVSNWVLTGSLSALLLFALALLAAGIAGLTLAVVQAVAAVVLLEIVNYIEHYGLQRRSIDGHYEPVGARHSWNSDYRLSNWMLFNLQLHADHHLHAERAFEKLRSLSDAPQLPAGYPLMVLVALLPPLWFRIMDPAVDRIEATA